MAIGDTNIRVGLRRPLTFTKNQLISIAEPPITESQYESKGLNEVLISGVFTVQTEAYAIATEFVANEVNQVLQKSKQLLTRSLQRGIRVDISFRERNGVKGLLLQWAMRFSVHYIADLTGAEFNQQFRIFERSMNKILEDTIDELQTTISLNDTPNSKFIGGVVQVYQVSYFADILKYSKNMPLDLELTPQEEQKILARRKKKLEVSLEERQFIIEERRKTQQPRLKPPTRREEPPSEPPKRKGIFRRILDFFRG